MTILILFASTEGQTRKIVLFMRERLERAGRKVRLIEASDDIDVDLSSFEQVIVAASLHAGSYQEPVATFAARHHLALNRMNATFVSVSLSAAGKDAEDIKGLADCVAAFERETGWRPARVEHVAGAFRYSAYNILKRWAMKYIAWRKGQSTDTSHDSELTDWAALARFVDEMAQVARAQPRPA